MKFLSNLNLNKNQLQNAVIHPLGTAPSTPAVGQIYYDTGDFELKIWNGTIFDVVGKEYTLANNILEASISGNVLTYAPFGTAAAGVLSATNATAAGTNNLAFSGHFYANKFNNLELTQGTHGFTIAGGSTDKNSLIFNDSASWTGNLTLNAWTASELRMFKGLIIGGTSQSTGAITLTTAADAASPTLIIGPTAIANTLPIFDANAALTNLANGTVGQSLRVVDIGSGVLAPRWTTGGSVDQNIVLKFDSGTTEGTDLYTYNGSTAKTVDFKGGTAITLDDAVAGAITIKHSDVTRTNTTTDPVPAATAFGGTFTVIDSVASNDQGHITGANTKTVTLPTETTLSDVDTGTGTWLTDITVNNHQITLSRSNTTQDTIQVGELIISTAGSKTGNLTVGGDTIITGNLTVNGTTTTISTEEIALADNIIILNSNEAGTPSQNAGLEIERGTQTNFQIIFDETNDDTRIGFVGALQPVLTRDEVANLAEGDILVFDATNKRAVGQTFDELALPQKYAVTIGDGAATAYTVTHNLNTTDITYSVKEIATGEIVFTNVTVTGVNAISVSFAVAPTNNQYRVVVIG